MGPGLGGDAAGGSSLPPLVLAAPAPLLGSSSPRAPPTGRPPLVRRELQGPHTASTPFCFLVSSGDCKHLRACPSSFQVSCQVRGGSDSPPPAPVHREATTRAGAPLLKSRTVSGPHPTRGDHSGSYTGTYSDQWSECCVLRTYKGLTGQQFKQCHRGDKGLKGTEERSGPQRAEQTP